MAGGERGLRAHSAAVVAVICALLALTAATATAYVCALWTWYGGWIVPGIIGGLVTAALFAGAVASAIVAIVERRRAQLAVVALVLSILPIGGVYGGCRKGWHDERCKDSIPGDARCAGFW